ncbi:MAG: efflux RND transporter periplasmic adaptor subunit [Cyanobacteria bacterium J06621_8]
MTIDRLVEKETTQKDTSEYRDNPESNQDSQEERSRERNWSKYLYILLSLGGIALAFFVARPMLTSSTENPPAESQARVLPVETIKVQPVDFYQVSRTYTGEIAAIRSSNIGFSRSGEIEAVLVREGDRVTRGQALAKLDARNLQTQRQQLVAQKARAEAQLKELQTGARKEDIDAAQAAVSDIQQQLKLQEQQRKRREFLYGQGAIAKEELDEFSFGEGALQARLRQTKSNLAELENGTRPEQIAAQQATVRQLEAQIADLDITIDKSTLKAPFNSIVAVRELDEGTVAAAGQSVIRLIENAAPEARIGMPDDAVNNLTIGSRQTLKLGSQSYRATVDAILPEVNSNTRTQVAVFKLDPSAISQINPGQTVRLELMNEIATDGFWLQTSALTQGIRGLWNCYVVVASEDGQQQVEQKAVEIMHQEGDRALVRGTLKPGDRIVTEGIHRLVPGQKIKVISNK